MADSVAFSDGTDPPSDYPTNHHASSSTEVHDGEKAKFDLVLRAEIITHHTKFNVRFFLSSLIGALIETEPDTIIKSKDGLHSFQTMEHFPKDKDTLALFFQRTASKNRRGSSIAVVELNVTSAQNLASLKKPTSVLFKHIEQNKIWLTQHKFDTLKLQSIGFFTDVSTVFTWKSNYENEIRSKLQACIAEDLAASTPGNVVDITKAETPPEFELNSRGVSHHYRSESGGKMLAYAQAYEILCESIHKNRLIALLMRSFGPEHSSTFIPYGMAKSDSAEFGDKIRHQASYLDNLKMITVYGLSPQVMERPMPLSDNPTFRGHLLDFQQCSYAADGSQTTTPMILSIERTNKTDSHGKFMFLCTTAEEPKLKEWIDTQLPVLYATAAGDASSDQTNGEAVFSAPSRGNFSKQEALLKEYAAKLRASPSIFKPTTDSQEDPALSGGYKYTRNRPSKTRKAKEIQLVYDPSDSLFPILRTPGRKGSPAPAPDGKNTYSARTAATIPSTSSPSDHHETGNPPHTGGDPFSTKNDVNDLRRLVEENDAKIAALVAAAKDQDERFDKMQTMHKQTQETVDILILQISALVALISRDRNAMNEDESHTLTISSKNKRTSTDSPTSSPSGNNQTRKKINDSTTPVKRLSFEGYSEGYSDNGTIISAEDDAGNSRHKPD
jgi:hypothetical protein